MPKTSLSMMVIAWGQYIHWAQLQFERFASIGDGDSDSHQIGVFAHWLAAEYVVLEGWRELGITDKRVSKLIQLYPENCETLRRCRNAVYHFQPEILDRRIINCLQNKNEEAVWSISLHYEFQRLLIAYPYALSGTIEEQAEVADEMERCIGWIPKDIPATRRIQLLRKCLEFQRMLASNDSPNIEEGSRLIDSTLEQLARVEDMPFVSKLTRWSVD